VKRGAVPIVRCPRVETLDTRSWQVQDRSASPVSIFCRLDPRTEPGAARSESTTEGVVPEKSANLGMRPRIPKRAHRQGRAKFSGGCDQRDWNSALR
jgi:hypothetical protein